MSQPDLSYLPNKLQAATNDDSNGKGAVNSTLNQHNGCIGMRDFFLNADFSSTDSAEEPYNLRSALNE